MSLALMRQVSNGRSAELPIRRLATIRRRLFEAIERPALAPLPGADYEFAEWRLARVSLDYHVEHGGFFYSVPRQLIRELVGVRATAKTIENFSRGKRVAAHQRRWGGRRQGTDPDHMPSGHRTASVDGGLDRPEHRRADRRHPGQPAASGAGLPHLPRRAAPLPRLAPARAETASARVLQIGVLTYKSIAPSLANRLTAAPVKETAAVVDHANLRGSGYFH